MNRNDLKKLIFPLTEREKQYRDNPKLSNPYYSILENKGMKNCNGSFNFLTFKHLNDLNIPNYENMYSKKHHSSICLNGNVIFKKQNRYFNIPLHSHEFIGINYVYSGDTKMYTTDSSINLDEGSIILMDSDFIHTLKMAKEKDIILNIQIDPEYLSNSILYRLGNSSIVAKFLIDSINDKTGRKHFLIFDCKNDERIKNIFEDMFCESFDPAVCTYELIENYLYILFIEMIRNYQTLQENILPHNSKKYIAEVLRYMNENSAHCTLESVAKHFNFNSKYLSRMIKLYTGETFKNLQLKMRMSKAIILINTTNLPINLIAEECGYKNQSFFYKKFQEIYNITPALYRKSTFKK